MAAKRIELPFYGIVVVVDVEVPGGGAISSELHEEPDPNSNYRDPGPIEFNAAMDGIESMILGHAYAGIDITTAAYIRGIQTAVEACGVHFS